MTDIEQLNEDPLNAWKNRCSSKGASKFSDSGEKENSTPSKIHAFDKNGKKVSSFDVIKRKEISEMSKETLDGYLEKAPDKANKEAFKASRALYNGNKKDHFAATKELINTNQNIAKAKKKIEMKSTNLVSDSVEIAEMHKDGILARYKSAAGAQASKLDKEAWASNDPKESKEKMDKANKRFSGIVKATNKQFSSVKEEILTETPKGDLEQTEKDFADQGNSINAPKKQKIHVVNKTSGKIVSTHDNFKAANDARNKVGSVSIHSIIKESDLIHIQKLVLIETGEIVTLNDILKKYIIEADNGSYGDGGEDHVITRNSKENKVKGTKREDQQSGTYKYQLKDLAKLLGPKIAKELQ